MDTMELDQQPERWRELVMTFGGVALMIAGAGMLLSSPSVRRYLARIDLAGLLQSAGPEVERYLRSRM